MVYGLIKPAIVAVSMAAIIAGLIIYNRRDAQNDLKLELERINAKLTSGALTYSEASRACFDAGGLWDFADAECNSPD